MKVTTIILLSILCIIGVFTLGYKLGVDIGVNKWITIRSPSMGAETVIILEQLRKGDNESAINMLEIKLDHYLLNSWGAVCAQYWYYENSIFSSLSERRDTYLYRISKYRAKYPFDFTSSVSLEGIINDDEMEILSKNQNKIFMLLESYTNNDEQGAKIHDLCKGG